MNGPWSRFVAQHPDLSALSDETLEASAVGLEEELREEGFTRFCRRGHSQRGGNYCGTCGAPLHDSLTVKQ